MTTPLRLAAPAEGRESPAVQVVPLRHASAHELAATLNDLVSGSAAGTRIVPDPRTNSLLVQALPEELPKILELIERLDRKVE